MVKQVANVSSSESVDVNGIKFSIHPVFDQYGASECGKIVNIDRKTILLGNLKNSCYVNAASCKSSEIQAYYIAQKDETFGRENLYSFLLL